MLEEKYKDIIVRSLSNEASQEDQKILSAWLAADPANRKYYKELESLWNLKENAVSISGTETKQDWQKLKSKIERQAAAEKKTIISSYQWIGIAASLLLLIAVTFIYRQSVKPKAASEEISINEVKSKSIEPTVQSEEEPVGPEQVVIAQPVGFSEKLYIYYLPDSTIVWLNKNSKLEFPETFDGNKREVTLYGEAFFDVRRNEKKPFIIYAGNTITTVLGTSFKISAYDEDPDIIISVQSGNVLFGSQHEKIELAKAQEGIYNKANNTLTKKVKGTKDRPEWMKDRQAIRSTEQYKNERSHPENYLVNNLKWKRNLIRQTVLEGEIYNSAILNSFENIGLRVSYYNSKGEKIGEKLFIAETKIEPGTSISYKHKLPDWFEKTKEVKVEIVKVEKMKEVF